MQLLLLALPLAASAQFVKYEELKPEVRQGARRTLSMFGPYTIPGASSSKGGLSSLFGDSTSWGSPFFAQVKKGLCNNLDGKPQDCTMFVGKVSVRYVDGRPADPSTGIYIHHILSSNVQKKETPWVSTCNNPNRAGMNVNGLTGGGGFLSTGEDSAADKALYVDPKGQLLSGYHIKSTDYFNYWAQLVNYNKEPAKVYVTFDMEWSPGLVGVDTKVTVVDATCGGVRIKMSEAGPTNTTSNKFYIMEEGRIMGARGHMHDGASGLHMFLNDKYMCTSEAKYGYGRDAMGGMAHGGGGHGHGRRFALPQAPKGTTQPKKDATGAKAVKASDPPKDAAKGDDGKGILTIASMTDCEGPWKVKKGDVVKFVGEYDLKKHPLRVSAGGSKQADVMVMMGVLFAPGTAPLKRLNGTTLD